MSREIKGAGYSPILHIFKLENEDEDVFTFGFELEINSRECWNNPNWESDSHFVYTYFHDFLAELWGSAYVDYELFYFKHDGSIGGGFEIVTQPMTYNYFLANQDKFHKVFNFLTEWGYASHKYGDCGLHFHIGNNAFEKNEIGVSMKAQQLEFCATNLNSIINYYKNELCVISRRRIEQIMRWASFTDNETFDFKHTYNKSKYYVKRNLKKRVGHSYNVDRYHALNVTNANTLEFRLLRGTLNWETFCISFNMVKNLANVSRLENHCVTWEDIYLNDLENEMKDYAIKYFDKQSKQPKWRNLEFHKNSAIYTSSNSVIKKQLLNKKLTEMGLI